MADVPPGHGFKSGGRAWLATDRHGALCCRCPGVGRPSFTPWELAAGAT